MAQDPGAMPADEGRPVAPGGENGAPEQSSAPALSNRAIFGQGLFVALIFIAMSAVTLDGGVLSRSAGFTIVVYCASTFMVWRREARGSLGLVDRLVVRVGFPVYLFIVHWLLGAKSALVAKGWLPLGFL